MKKIICSFLSVILMFSFFTLDTVAASEDEIAPYVIDFNLTSTDIFSKEADNARASGLILSYGLSVQKDGTSLVIKGITNCAADVVKCGFKNLTVERRKTSSDSWSDYYEYGNVYYESSATSVSTTLSVASGYQYRVTCKHYAKKNILSVQTIANTSNIVTVS